MNLDVRENQLNIKMSDDEWARLDRLTVHFGLNAAGVVRFLLREKERELGLGSSDSKKASKVKK